MAVGVWLCRMLGFVATRTDTKSLSQDVLAVSDFAPNFEWMLELQNSTLYAEQLLEFLPKGPAACEKANGDENLSAPAPAMHRRSCLMQGVRRIIQEHLQNIFGALPMRCSRPPRRIGRLHCHTGNSSATSSCLAIDIA